MNVARARREQEGDRGCDFAGRPDAAERHRSGDRAPHRLGKREHLRRPDHARHDDVDAHAARPPLRGQRATEARDPGLRGHVGGLARQAEFGCGGGDEHDRGAPARLGAGPQRRPGRLGQHEGAGEVRVQIGLPVGEREAVGSVDRVDHAGVRHHGVEAAERSGDLPDPVADRAGVAQVERRGRGDSVRRPGGERLREVARPDPTAGVGQRGHDRATEAAAGAGDERPHNGFSRP